MEILSQEMPESYRHGPLVGEVRPHEMLADGRRISEWFARVSNDVGDVSAGLYPMLAIDAATHDDMQVQNDADPDWGHLRSAIWILHPSYRGAAIRIARELLHDGFSVRYPCDKGIAISLGARHRLVKISDAGDQS